MLNFLNLIFRSRSWIVLSVKPDATGKHWHYHYNQFGESKYGPQRGETIRFKSKREAKQIAKTLNPKAKVKYR